ncbi:putative RNA-directed DNA polymerase from transposon X-element [Trichonephila clavipes]|nr:putative RNA-directed DNA polymerase from transposon X-element [Trichonephila clavipes]
MSPLSLENKVIFYKQVLRPVITYGSPVLGTAAATHMKKIQVIQNKILRVMTNAPWYVRNDVIHNDLHMEPISNYITRLSRNVFKSIESHDNPIIKAQTLFTYPHPKLNMHTLQRSEETRSAPNNTTKNTLFTLLTTLISCIALHLSLWVLRRIFHRVDSLPSTVPSSFLRFFPYLRRRSASLERSCFGVRHPSPFLWEFLVFVKFSNHGLSFSPNLLGIGAFGADARDHLILVSAEALSQNYSTQM